MEEFIKKLEIILLLMLFHSLLAADQNEGSIHIGIGLGIQSYPSALDPYKLVKGYPVLYPEIEADIQLIDRIYLTNSVSRVVIEGSLLGPILCPQFLELYTIALGAEYNFGSQRREFKTGIQVLAGFSEYGTGSYDDYFSSGLGVKVYASALRPLTQYFSWGIRSGIQRLTVQATPHSENIHLDSFNIEIAGYFSL